MRKNKLWGVFDKRPLIWFHYVLLVLVILLVLYITVAGWRFYQVIKWSYILKDFVLWYIVLSISDQLIHKVLGVD